METAQTQPRFFGGGGEALSPSLPKFITFKGSSQ